MKGLVFYLHPSINEREDTKQGNFPLGKQGIGNWWNGNWEEREWRFESSKPPEVETSGNLSANISVRGGAEAGDSRKSSGCKRQGRKGLEFLEKYWNEWGAR
jgi:hypothetical protein